MRPIRETITASVEAPPGKIELSEGAVYLHEYSGEPRSHHVEQQRAYSPSVEFIQVRSSDQFYFEASSDRGNPVSLRNRDAIQHFFRTHKTKTIYIDITGMPHNTWAPLIRVAIEEDLDFSVVYVEPATYSASASPRPGQVYDLSKRITGIRPIPLFAQVNEVLDSRVRLIALLGFEGARFSFLVEQLQPPRDEIIPIVGVPGFRSEYPFATFLGNSVPLANTKSFRQVRFAKASCPFALFYVLQQILSEAPDAYLKVGLIGTKPHALGAVMLATAKHERVELVYDQVIPREGRSAGAMRCHIYQIGAFRSELELSATL